MEVLDLKLRVPNYPTLDQATKESILAGEEFSPLPHSVQLRLLGQLAHGNWLVTQVQDSAVLITEDWVVSIHGKKLVHTVSAMAVLLNSIGRQLNTPVEVDLLTLQNGHDEPLHLLLERQSRKDRVIGAVKWGGVTIIVSALVGALVQWALFGGLLQ
jgi:hypothetical protein